MSRYQYLITIKKPESQKADAVTLLMLLPATVFFLYVAVVQWYSMEQPVAAFYFWLSAFIVLWSMYRYVSARRNHGIAFYRWALLAAAIGWWLAPVSNYWLAGLFAMAAFMEQRVKIPQELGVDESGIAFNTLPAREYSWKDINHLLLKEGILTVDYKNNKLYQHTIESEISADLENEFNRYCESKLAAAAS